jgi:zinc protease
MIRFVATFVAIVVAFPVWAETQIKEVISPSGITAWLVEEHSIPFVALEIRFAGGASLDAPGKRGATNLMTGLLEEGAGDLDARGFARATEALAASFGYDVNDDYLSISARFLTENRTEAVDLLRSTIMEPQFADADIERVRAQVIANIQSNEKDPNDIASEAFSKLVFGDHPYGSTLNGTLDSVAGLTRDDLVAARAAVLARDRIYIAAVGDITAEELGDMLDTLLGALPETGAPLPGVADVHITGGITVVEFDTPQSVALFGQRGIKQDDDDFFAAYVMNQILGGGSFESRLMTEVREKRGLTYGVYSYLAPRDYAETYLGSVASANNKIAQSIEVIRTEWSKMATEGVTEQELQDAKTYLTGAYPLRFDGNGPIANIMVGMQMQGLPIDYISTRNARVDAVTLDDVNRVARDLLDPENLRFVVVGKPEGLTTTDW